MASPLDLLLDQLADAVAERLAARLKPIVEEAVTRRLPPASGPTFYTTNKKGPHLPGKSRRWMLDHVRKMPGARKAGRDWEIGVADYDAWVAAEYSRRCANSNTLPEKPLPAKASEAEDEIDRIVTRSLEAQGFRFAG